MLTSELSLFAIWVNPLLRPLGKLYFSEPTLQCEADISASVLWFCTRAFFPAVTLGDLGVDSEMYLALWRNTVRYFNSKVNETIYALEVKYVLKILIGESFLLTIYLFLPTWDYVNLFCKKLWMFKKYTYIICLFPICTRKFNVLVFLNLLKD